MGRRALRPGWFGQTWPYTYFLVSLVVKGVPSVVRGGWLGHPPGVLHLPGWSCGKNPQPSASQCRRLHNRPVQPFLIMDWSPLHKDLGCAGAIGRESVTSVEWHQFERKLERKASKNETQSKKKEHEVMLGFNYWGLIWASRIFR